jgi:hypothetical protein
VILKEQLQGNSDLNAGKSNLSKFQAKILQQICNNEDIIIAHADKNLDLLA